MRMKRPKRFSLYPSKNVIHSAQPFPLRMGRGFLPLCRRIRKTRPSSQPPPSAFLLVGEAPERLLFGFSIRQ